MKDTVFNLFDLLVFEGKNFEGGKLKKIKH